MLTIDQLKQIVHRSGLSIADKALLCVAAAGGQGATITAVRANAAAAGVKAAKTINFSMYLGRATGKVFKTPTGWELSNVGREYVAELEGKFLAASPAAAEAKALRDLLTKLKSDDARAFLTEAIVCTEQSLFRAAVVLSWAGAIAILHDVVVAKHLVAFNAEAARRDPKWKPAKTTDDLGRSKEVDFLNISEAISLIGKNVKQELEKCLKLRNGCGHPNSLKIGANMVAAHLETLTLNVYAKYG